MVDRDGMTDGEKLARMLCLLANDEPDVGVTIAAHGGSESWRVDVGQRWMLYEDQARRQLSEQPPTE